MTKEKIHRFLISFGMINIKWIIENVCLCSFALIELDHGLIDLIKLKEIGCLFMSFWRQKDQPSEAVSWTPLKSIMTWIKPLTMPSASALFQNSVNLGKVVVFCENQTYRPAGGCICRIYSFFEIHRSVCPRPGRANALFHKLFWWSICMIIQTCPAGG